jgi:hypothetical protein
LNSYGRVGTRFDTKYGSLHPDLPAKDEGKIRIDERSRNGHKEMIPLLFGCAEADTFGHGAMLPGKIEKLPLDFGQGFCYYVIDNISEQVTPYYHPHERRESRLRM